MNIINFQHSENTYLMSRIRIPCLHSKAWRRQSERGKKSLKKVAITWGDHLQIHNLKKTKTHTFRDDIPVGVTLPDKLAHECINPKVNVLKKVLAKFLLSTFEGSWKVSGRRQLQTSLEEPFHPLLKICLNNNKSMFKITKNLFNTNPRFLFFCYTPRY